VKFAAALSSVIAGSAAISKVVAAAGERLDRRGAWTGHPPLLVINPSQKSLGLKIPRDCRDDLLARGVVQLAGESLSLLAAQVRG
jgi:hypothetical protein